MDSIRLAVFIVSPSSVYLAKQEHACIVRAMRERSKAAGLTALIRNTKLGSPQQCIWFRFRLVMATDRVDLVAQLCMHEHLHVVCCTVMCVVCVRVHCAALRVA